MDLRTLAAKKHHGDLSSAYFQSKRSRGAPGVSAEGVEADCSLSLPRKWSSSLCKGVAHWLFKDCPPPDVGAGQAAEGERRVPAHLEL